VGSGGRHLPDFYLKKISGSFSQLLSAETSGHPLLHPRHERCPNSRARDLDLASASSGVFNNSSHLDFGHPFSRTDGRHACAIAAPLVTVGFAVPTFRVSWPLNLVFSSFRIWRLLISWPLDLAGTELVSYDLADFWP
jgi:hypothetical protein